MGIGSVHYQNLRSIAPFDIITDLEREKVRTCVEELNENAKPYNPFLPKDEAEEQEAEEQEAESEAEKTPDEPQQGEFTITVLGIKSRTIPELNDDLAKEEGEYESLEDLKTAVRADLQKAAEETTGVEAVLLR